LGDVGAAEGEEDESLSKEKDALASERSRYRGLPKGNVQGRADKLADSSDDCEFWTRRDTDVSLSLDPKERSREELKQRNSRWFLALG
jgi:hypothetical protein